MKGWFRRPVTYGLLLRLVLLPLGAYWDLVDYYCLSHHLAYHGTIPIEQLGGYYQIWPPFYFHAAWLWLIKPLIGPYDFWSHTFSPTGAILFSDEAVRQIFYQTNFRLLIALLKLPYVLVELLMIRLVLRNLVRSEVVRRRLAWFLWLNPISLYVVSLLGAFESIPMLLLLLSIVWLRRRTFLAGFCYSLAVIMKVYPLALLPFLILFGAQRVWQRWRIVAACLLPIAAFLLFGEFLGISAFSSAMQLPHYEFLVSSKIPLRGPHDSIYLFVIGYMLLVFHAAQRRRISLERLVGYASATFLLYYSTSFFRPQYVFWSLPFVGILLARRPTLLWLFGIQVVCLGLYTLQWGRFLTTHLLLAVQPRYFGFAPSPYEWLAQYMNPDHLIGLAHSVFAAASLWLIYQALRLTGQAAEHQDRLTASQKLVTRD